MDNCFMCNAKLKRKTHYLCKDCYNDSTEYYDDILSKCKDIDKYIIDVLNGKSYSQSFKATSRSPCVTIVARLRDKKASSLFKTKFSFNLPEISSIFS